MSIYTNLTDEELILKLISELKVITNIDVDIDETEDGYADILDQFLYLEDIVFSTTSKSIQKVFDLISLFISKVEGSEKEQYIKKVSEMIDLYMKSDIELKLELLITLMNMMKEYSIDKIYLMTLLLKTACKLESYEILPSDLIRVAESMMTIEECNEILIGYRVDIYYYLSILTSMDIYKSQEYRLKILKMFVRYNLKIKYSFDMHDVINEIILNSLYHQNIKNKNNKYDTIKYLIDNFLHNIDQNQDEGQKLDQGLYKILEACCSREISKCINALNEYKNKDALIKFSIIILENLKKLKLSEYKSDKPIKYEELKDELKIKTTEELEELLLKAIYEKYVFGRLNSKDKIFSFCNSGCEYNEKTDWVSLMGRVIKCETDIENYLRG